MPADDDDPTDEQLEAEAAERDRRVRADEEAREQARRAAEAAQEEERRLVDERREAARTAKEERDRAKEERKRRRTRGPVEATDEIGSAGEDPSLEPMEHAPPELPAPALPDSTAPAASRDMEPVSPGNQPVAAAPSMDVPAQARAADEVGLDAEIPCPDIDSLVGLVERIIQNPDDLDKVIVDRRRQYGSPARKGRHPWGRHASLDDPAEQARRRARAFAEESLLWSVHRITTTAPDLRSSSEHPWYVKLRQTPHHLRGTLIHRWIDTRCDEILGYHATRNDIDLKRIARRLDRKSDGEAVAHLSQNDAHAVIDTYRRSLDATKVLLEETRREYGITNPALPVDPKSEVGKRESQVVRAERRLRDAEEMLNRIPNYRCSAEEVSWSERRESELQRRHDEAPESRAPAVPDPVEPMPEPEPIRTHEPVGEVPADPPPEAVTEEEAAAAPDVTRQLLEEAERQAATERELEAARMRSRIAYGPDFHGMMRLVREILDGTSTVGEAVEQRRSDYGFEPPSPWGKEAVVPDDAEEQLRRRATAWAEEALFETVGRIHGTIPGRRTKDEDWWLLGIEDASRDKRRKVLGKWIDGRVDKIIAKAAGSDLGAASASILEQEADAAANHAAAAEAGQLVATRESALSAAQSLYEAALVEAGISAGKVHPDAVRGTALGDLLAQVKEAESALRGAEYALDAARARRDGKELPPPVQPTRRISKAEQERTRYEQGGPGSEALYDLIEKLLDGKIDRTEAVTLRREASVIGDPSAWGIEAVVPGDPDLERDRRAHAYAEEAIFGQIERVAGAPDKAMNEERDWLSNIRNKMFRAKNASGWIVMRRRAILKLVDADTDLATAALRAEDDVVAYARYRNGVQTAMSSYIAIRKDVFAAREFLDQIVSIQKRLDPNDRRYPKTLLDVEEATKRVAALTAEMKVRDRDILRASADKPGKRKPGNEIGDVAAPGTQPAKSARERWLDRFRPQSDSGSAVPDLSVPKHPVTRGKSSMAQMIELGLGHVKPDHGDVTGEEARNEPKTPSPAPDRHDTSKPRVPAPAEPMSGNIFGSSGKAGEAAGNIVYLRPPARSPAVDPLTGEAERRASIEKEDRERAQAAEGRRKAVADWRKRADREARKAERDSAAKANRRHVEPPPAPAPPKWGAPRITEIAAAPAPQPPIPAAVSVAAPRGPGRPANVTLPAPNRNDRTLLRSQLDRIETASGRKIGPFDTTMFTDLVAALMWADSGLKVSGSGLDEPVTIAVRRARSALVAEWHEVVTNALDLLPEERRFGMRPLVDRVAILHRDVTIDEVLACCGRLGLHVRLQRPGSEAADR